MTELLVPFDTTRKCNHSFLVNGNKTAKCGGETCQAIQHEILPNNIRPEMTVECEGLKAVLFSKFLELLFLPEKYQLMNPNTP